MPATSLLRMHVISGLHFLLPNRLGSAPDSNNAVITLCLKRNADTIDYNEDALPDTRL